MDETGCGAAGQFIYADTIGALDPLLQIDTRLGIDFGFLVFGVMPERDTHGHLRHCWSQSVENSRIECADCRIVGDRLADRSDPLLRHFFQNDFLWHGFLLFDKPDTALESAEAIVFLLDSRLLLGPPQQEHAPHLLPGHLIIQADGNLLQRESEDP